MKLATDWAEQKSRVRWLHTAFGLGQMVAEWEGHDGIVRKVKARTTLELLGKVRAEIDSSEIEPPKAEPDRITAFEQQQQWYAAQQKSYLEQQQGLNQYRPSHPADDPPKKKNTKPKPPENPYRRKFG